MCTGAAGTREASCCAAVRQELRGDVEDVGGQVVEALQGVAEARTAWVLRSGRAAAAGGLLTEDGRRCQTTTAGGEEVGADSECVRCCVLRCAAARCEECEVVYATSVRVYDAERTSGGGRDGADIRHVMRSTVDSRAELRAELTEWRLEGQPPSSTCRGYPHHNLRVQLHHMSAVGLSATTSQPHRREPQLTVALHALRLRRAFTASSSPCLRLPASVFSLRLRRSGGMAAATR